MRLLSKYTRLLSPWPTFFVTQASKILNQKGSFTRTSRALSWGPTSRGTCGWWGWLLHRWWRQKEQFHHVILQDKKTSLDTLPARRDADVPIRVGQWHAHKSWYDSVFCWNRNWNHKYPILEPIPVQQKNLISDGIGIRISNFWKLERERERWSEGREGTERSTIKREGGKSCKEEREEEMKRPNSKSEIRKRRVGSQKQNRTRSCSTARFDSDFHPHSYSHTHPI